MPQSFGPYQVLSELGHGGMGIVYLAKAPKADGPVAIKVLPHHFLTELEFRVRFDREAEAVAALASVPVVPIYSYGIEGDQPYIVMPYLSGGTLAERIQAGRIPLAETIKILTRLAEALDVAHANGIIHRDLKPSNVLYNEQSLAYLADFGLAKLQEASTQFSVTGSSILGTPSYMSPEQATGNRALDGRTDIYSLGVMLYELLSGHLPFGGETPFQVMYRHVHEPVPPLVAPHLSDLDQWNAIVNRAMAKDPDQRYPTAGALVKEIIQVAALNPATAISTEPSAGTGRSEVNSAGLEPRPTLPGPRPPITLLGLRVSRRGALMIGIPALIAPLLIVSLWTVGGGWRPPLSPTLTVTAIPSSPVGSVSQPASATVRATPVPPTPTATASSTLMPSPTQTLTATASATASQTATSTPRPTQRVPTRTAVPSDTVTQVPPVVSDTPSPTPNSQPHPVSTAAQPPTSQPPTSPPPTSQPPTSQPPTSQPPPTRPPTPPPP